MMLKTSKSINNPYKLSHKDQSFKSSKSLSKCCKKSSFSNENFSQNFVVDTKDNETCVSFDYKTKVTEVENMVKAIVRFLNDKVFTKKKLSELVLDFIQDKNRTWIFLDCKGYSLKKRRKTIIDKLTKMKTRSLTPMTSHIKILISHENPNKKSSKFLNYSTHNSPNVTKIEKPNQPVNYKTEKINN